MKIKWFTSPSSTKILLSKVNSDTSTSSSDFSEELSNFPSLDLTLRVQTTQICSRSTKFPVWNRTSLKWDTTKMELQETLKCPTHTKYSSIKTLRISQTSKRKLRLTPSTELLMLCKTHLTDSYPSLPRINRRMSFTTCTEMTKKSH